MEEAKLILLTVALIHSVGGNETTGFFADYNCNCGEKDSSVEEKACGNSEAIPEMYGSEERIVNGCDAAHTPWYTLILIGNGPSSAACGGSLINKFWVLSAAHCFCNSQSFCERPGSPKEGLIVPQETLSKLQIRIGPKQKLSRFDSKRLDQTNLGEHTFRVEEIEIHPKYLNLVKDTDGQIYERKDYDFALVRLDYPVVDEEYGIGIIKVLEKRYFHKSTILPICLPPPDYKDTLVKSKVVGFGITKEQKKCITDGNGPEIFKRCADRWHVRDGDDTEIWDGVGEKGGFYCSDTPPPSTQSKICENFIKEVERIEEKKRNGNPLTTAEEDILREKKKIKEFLLIPGETPKYQDPSQNVTACFLGADLNTKWCGTCNDSAPEGTPGHCNMQDKYTKDDEAAIANADSGWGFCDKSCEKRNGFNNDGLRMAKLTVLSDQLCSEMGNQVLHNSTVITANINSEICAGFVNWVNASVLNYTLKETKENSRMQLSLFNVPKTVADKNQFRSQRLKNNKIDDFTNKTNMIIGGVDSCKGDSGGPLWNEGSFTDTQGKQHRDVAVLIGVVSRGGSCAAHNTPGTYGRVKKISAWIRLHADKSQVYTVKGFTDHVQGIPGGRLLKPGDRVLVNPFCREPITRTVDKLPDLPVV